MLCFVALEWRATKIFLFTLCLVIHVHQCSLIYKIVLRTNEMLYATFVRYDHTNQDFHVIFNWLMDYRLTYNVKVYCDEHFYGEQCDVYCNPSENPYSHLTCDSTTGLPICDEGKIIIPVKKLSKSKIVVEPNCDWYE